MTELTQISRHLQRISLTSALAFGAFSAWGQLCDGVNVATLLLAFVWLLFQLVTNFFAIGAQRLFRSGHSMTAGALVIMMIATGLFGHEALTNAFAQAQLNGFARGMNAHTVSALFVLAPFIEVAAARASDLLGTDAAPVSTDHRVAPVGVAIAAGLVSGAMGTAPMPDGFGAAHERPEPRGRTPEVQAPAHGRSTDVEAGRRGAMPRLGAQMPTKARALKTAHPLMTQEAIAAEVGASRSSVQRWLALG